MYFPAKMVKTLRLVSPLIFAAATLPYAFAQGGAPASAQAASKSAAMATIAAGKPYWVELTPSQRAILEPLQPEWASMGQLQRKKWIEIANKYSVLKPDEQARIQERMRDWVKLTPEQRMAVRENFARSTQVKPEKKSEQWQQYQQLSDEQKKQLAEAVQKKKTVTNLPSEAQRTAKPLAPIKQPKPASSAALPVPRPAVAQVAPASAPQAALPPATEAVPASQPAAK